MDLTKQEVLQIEDAIEFITTKACEYNKPILEYFDDEFLRTVEDYFYELALQAKDLLKERSNIGEG